MKVIVHDVSGKDVWFGPYKLIEIHEHTVWAEDDSGRKVTLGWRDAEGFWVVTDGDWKARGKTMKVSRNAVIKAAAPQRPHPDDSPSVGLGPT